FTHGPAHEAAQDRAAGSTARGTGQVPGHRADGRAGHGTAPHAELLRIPADGAGAGTEGEKGNKGKGRSDKSHGSILLAVKPNDDPAWTGNPLPEGRGDVPQRGPRLGPDGPLASNSSRKPGQSKAQICAPVPVWREKRLGGGAGAEALFHVIVDDTAEFFGDVVAPERGHLPAVDEHRRGR